MTSYIIKSILCSGLLLLFYHLFLEGEKMHRINRFYLLFSLLFSLVIPLITIEIEAKKIQETVSSSMPGRLIQRTLPKSFAASQPEFETDRNSLPENSPIIFYALVSCLLFLRFFKNIFAVLQSKTGQRMIDYQESKLILVPENIVTYTFLSSIFVTESAFVKNQIEDEVLTHELAHVRQKHTLDILFIEFIKAAFWINPIWFLYKKAIQLNHEFLADDAVLDTFPNVKNYQLLLLDKTIHRRQIDLTSSFTFSITKKRLAMMTKSTSRTRQILKKVAIAIFSLSLAFTFSDKIYSQSQSKTSQERLKKNRAINEKGESPEKKTDSQTVSVSDDTIRPANTRSGPGISSALIEEFNTSVKTYTKFEKASNGKSYMTFRQMPIATKQRLYKLYSQMNRQQQDKSKLTFVEGPIPVKRPPTEEVFENWKDKNMFGVWIDNKKVSNTALDKYKASDIAEWWSSKLYANARKGKIYKYQLDLTTNQEFDRTYDARVNDRIMIGVKDFLQD